MGLAGTSSPGKMPVSKGSRRSLALKDLRRQSEYLIARRQEIMAATARYLAACAAAQGIGENVDVAALAADHQLDPQALSGWLNYLGTVPQGAVVVENHMTGRVTTTGGYNFVQGWSTNDLPSLVANSSDQEAHIPGLSRPHAVTVHPTPNLQVVVGWLSPVATTAEISAHVVRAHTACGNGISWALDVRRGSSRRRLASGTSDQQKEPIAGPFENVNIRPGDLVSLAIGPRDANHACDLTEIDLTVKATDGSGRVWQLAPDISPDVLAGNPHADRFGNKAVWHFYTEPTSGEVLFAPLIPADSVLSRWRDAKEPNEKKQLTEEVAKLLSVRAGRR